MIPRGDEELDQTALGWGDEMTEWNSKHASVVASLTDPSLSAAEAHRLLSLFARTNGWKPSDILMPSADTQELVSGHVVVEHGLTYSATITFLRSNRPFADLTDRTRLRLASLSYNNLVDWHLFPRPDGVAYLYNRSGTLQTEYVHSSTLAEPPWSAPFFRTFTAKARRPAIKPLDETVIDTVKHWRGAIHHACNVPPSNKELGDLFNAIILLRTLEDLAIWRGHRSPQSRLLCEDHQDARRLAPPGNPIRRAAIELGALHWLERFAPASLRFERLDAILWRHMLSDFYHSEHTPFQFDFSVISKHALSRIYEHYVALLRTDDSDQLSLFHSVSVEDRDKLAASVYTPQYVSSFFRKIWEQNTPPIKLRSAKALDPACGSGVFLRMILESQLDADHSWQSADHTPSLSNVVGIDVDPAACAAAFLSLTLLHLASTEELPKLSPVINAEALEHYLSDPDAFNGRFDVVVANPPFIAWNRLRASLQEGLDQILQSHKSGKPDLYLGFVQMAMQSLAPDGMLCFVLPYQFLSANAASKVRQRLAAEFDVVAVVDLSTVQVFPSVRVYVILLVCRKRSEKIAGSTAMVARCTSAVGDALVDVIDRRTSRTSEYETFEVPQSHFRRDSWEILPSREMELLVRLERLPRLEDMLEVGQGLITGDDAVFISLDQAVPPSERSIWPPLLRDREMLRFEVPSRVRTRVFVPFRNGERMTWEQISDEFPVTAKHLRQRQDRLNTRAAVKRGDIEWWCPERARPDRMFVPKIVSPELMASPRFGLDAAGKYAVSHSPIMFVGEHPGGLLLLKYVCAVLNSSLGFWQLSKGSTRYDRSFVKILPRNLKRLRLPNPTGLPPAQVLKAMNLVDARGGAGSRSALDDCVGDMFELTPLERRIFDPDS